MAQTLIEWNLVDDPQLRPGGDRILILVGWDHVLGKYEIMTGYYSAGVYWVEDGNALEKFQREDRRIAGWAHWPEALTAKEVFEKDEQE